MDIHFCKYQGTGNDFVMIDDRDEHFEMEDHALIKHLCDRRFGVGADGLILLRKSSEYDFKMIYFNADGYEGSMCGNGGRAIVRFAHDLGIISNQTKFIAVDGEHEASVTSNVVSLKMADVDLVEQNENDFFMDTGSPHFVAFVKNVQSYDVVEKGTGVRYNDRFKEHGTNVNFVEEIDKNSLYVRTYERGVENETLSCGTGVTACALAASFLDHESPISVKTLGGDLSISFEKAQGVFKNVFLMGPAKKVFEGKVSK